MKASTCFGFAVRVLCGVLGLVFGAVAQIVIQDENAHSIQLNRPPQRIVSLLPSLTETICELGDCAKVVGVDRFSNFPASVQKLPRLGGLDDTSIETLVALGADVPADQMSRTICALGDAAAMPVRAFLKHYRDEFMYHIEHKKCLVPDYI